MMLRHFQNQPTTNFSLPENRSAFCAALEAVRSSLGERYPIIIDGERRYQSGTFDSTSPAEPKLVIGRFPKAECATAVEALEAADRAFPAWSRVPALERAGYLLSAAAQISKRRHELSSWLVYEVGKSWDEADGEVAESVDLLRFYAAQALRFDGSQTEQLGSIPEECNDFFYVPLGAGVVISPWNFPIALTFGMASAAIVAGNTVVIKPASTSPVSVHKVAEIFLEAGLPPGVLNVITGSGAAIGDALVDHPRTRFVAFTGSMDVGIRIFERSAKVHPGQIWLKRTVLEMGGKNAVIVDREADLALAADGVVTSAFSFQGQKCSAGSRSIVDQAIYDEFVERVLSRAKELRVGNTVDQTNQVGPVIDAAAFRKVNEFIETGKKEARLLLNGHIDAGEGYFIAPTIFADVAPDAVIAQEEIFGPVLACIRSKDFDDALNIANGTKYGLTGAVFSKNRGKLERARKEFNTGNLYFNRKSTGALMGIHPFGGFNMSGTDSKAGGPDYLLLFLQGKSVGDKLL